MQIEGFWLWLLSGAMAACVIHYLIAKILGPFIFNRGWCGWACWTAAVLDLLPYKKSPGRIKGWGYLRYLHFAASMALVFALVYVSGYNLKSTLGFVDLTGTAKETYQIPYQVYASLWQIPELWWFLTGNLMYYFLGIFLAFALKDNRAFCKYVCPITAFLKIGSRASLVKIRGDKNKCVECGLCSKNCPMDIEIIRYTNKGKRVTSSECIICQTFVNACPKEALKLTFGFDAGVKEFLRSGNAQTREEK